jgi:hypothetical protein
VPAEPKVVGKNALIVAKKSNSTMLHRAIGIKELTTMGRFPLGYLSLKHLV